jgi:anti-sigma regulatory factor (Ser/Thr protein kinase)
MPSLRLTLPGGLSSVLVDRLHAGVLAMGREAAVDAELLPITALVVEEICTNIMEHSNATWLKVRVSRRGERIRVEVADDGKPFNPVDAIKAQADLDLREMKERRLGLYMVKHLSSSVGYTRSPEGQNQTEFEFDPEALDGAG